MDVFGVFSEDEAIRRMPLAPRQLAQLVAEFERRLCMPRGLLLTYLGADNGSSAANEDEASRSSHAVSALCSTAAGGGSVPVCAHIRREIAEVASSSFRVPFLLLDDGGTRDFVRNFTACTGECARCQSDHADSSSTGASGAGGGVPPAAAFSVVHGHCLRCATAAPAAPASGPRAPSCVCLAHMHDHHAERMRLSTIIRARLDGDGGADQDDGDDADGMHVHVTRGGSGAAAVLAAEEAQAAPAGDADAEGDDGDAQADAHAVELSRHGVFCIASGSPDGPTVVVYCCDCNTFAPIAAFAPPADAAIAGTDGTAREDPQAQQQDRTTGENGTATIKKKTLESTDCADRILSRLLLVCDAVLTLERSLDSRVAYWDWLGSIDALAGSARGGGTAATGDWSAAPADKSAPSPAAACASLFLHVNEMFPGDDARNDAFEEGVEETQPLALLPHATWRKQQATSDTLCSRGNAADAVPSDALDGDLYELCLSDEQKEEVDPTLAPAATTTALEGYWMRFASADVLQARLALLRDARVAGTPTLRCVFLQSERKWVPALVLRGAVVGLSQADQRAPVLDAAACRDVLPPLPRCVAPLLPSSSAAAAAVDAAAMLSPATVACPLSSHSRTVNVFLQMLTVAHAMTHTASLPQEQQDDVGQ